MHHFPVQGEGLHRLVRGPEDGAARGFIDAPGFQAHVAVFHQVHPADAVFAAQFVQPGQEVGRAQGARRSPPPGPRPQSRSPRSGACPAAASGDRVSTNMSAGGSAQGSSRMPPSKLMCNRLRSLE